MTLSDHPALPAVVVDRLRCPTCNAGITQSTEGLSCRSGHVIACHHRYIDARPDRVSDATAATFRSFGYEWTRFRRIRPEDEAYWWRYFADLDVSQLQGRVGLDAGCGSGRYSVFTAQHLRALVALDGSDAVETAASNLAGCRTATVVRADLRRPPLAPEAFDFISCLGALHHLEQPRQGFDALVDLLAPGGILLVYLYSRPSSWGLRSVALRTASGLRRATTKLPAPLLRTLSWPTALVLWLTVVRLGALVTSRRGPTASPLPLAAYHGMPMRSLWLDTFDRLSAPIEHRYLWEDVRPWYTHRGLAVDSVRDESGLFIVAHRP